MVDASPYELGAWLSVEGLPTEYFADLISDEDCRHMRLEDRTGSKGQQAFEALALLVAMRLWLPQFKHKRVLVTLRGDNVAALTLVAKMQPKSIPLGVIARELALDISSSKYAPDFVQHIPGVTNMVADALSRKWQDGKDYLLPSILHYAQEVTPTTRTSKWWRTVPA